MTPLNADLIYKHYPSIKLLGTWFRFVLNPFHLSGQTNKQLKNYESKY